MPIITETQIYTKLVSLGVPVDKWNNSNSEYIREALENIAKLDPFPGPFTLEEFEKNFDKYRERDVYEYPELQSEHGLMFKRRLHATFNHRESRDIFLDYLKNTFRNLTSTIERDINCGAKIAWYNYLKQGTLLFKFIAIPYLDDLDQESIELVKTVAKLFTENSRSYPQEYLGDGAQVTQLFTEQDEQEKFVDLIIATAKKLVDSTHDSGVAYWVTFRYELRTDYRRFVTFCANSKLTKKGVLTANKHRELMDCLLNFYRSRVYSSLYFAKLIDPEDNIYIEKFNAIITGDRNLYYWIARESGFEALKVSEPILSSKAITTLNKTYLSEYSSSIFYRAFKSSNIVDCLKELGEFEYSHLCDNHYFLALDELSISADTNVSDAIAEIKKIVCRGEGAYKVLKHCMVGWLFNSFLTDDVSSYDKCMNIIHNFLVFQHYLKWKWDVEIATDGDVTHSYTYSELTQECLAFFGVPEGYLILSLLSDSPIEQTNLAVEEKKELKQFYMEMFWGTLAFQHGAEAVINFRMRFPENVSAKHAVFCLQVVNEMALSSALLDVNTLRQYEGLVENFMFGGLLSEPAQLAACRVIEDTSEADVVNKNLWNRLWEVSANATIRQQDNPFENLRTLRSQARSSCNAYLGEIEMQSKSSMLPGMFQPKHTEGKRLVNNLLSEIDSLDIDELKSRIQAIRDRDLNSLSSKQFATISLPNSK